MLIAKETCDQYTDNELVEETLRNVDYLSCIYARYEQRLLRFITRISSLNAEESRDVLQDAFIKIWKNLNAYDPSVKLSSWLYRIVRNETISQWRKKTGYGKVSMVPITEKMENVLPELLEADDLTEEGIDLLHNLVDGIPGKYREVIVLRYFEKMNYEEISDVLKIPEGTVAARLNRGRKMVGGLIREQRIEFESN